MIVEVFHNRLIVTTCCFVLILGETATKKPYPSNWLVFCWIVAIDTYGQPIKDYQNLVWVSSGQLHRIFHNFLLKRRISWHLHLIRLKDDSFSCCHQKVILQWTLLYKSSINFGHLLASPSNRCKSIGGRLRDSYFCWTVKCKLRGSSDESSFVFSLQ